jgi:DNA-binding CsgD family transcriptional regulator
MGLPPRQLQVAQLAAAGLSNKEIGARLWLSPSTVANYLRRIRERLGFAGRREIAAQLASLAERQSTEP